MVVSLLWVLSGVFRLSGQVVEVPPAPFIPKNPERAAVADRRPASFGQQIDPPRAVVLPALSDSEKQAAGEQRGAPAIGVNRAFDPSLQRAGSCETLPSGTSVWRLEVSSPGASGIRLHFSEFDAGGGQVWAHTGSEPFVDGPFSGRGVFGDREFWTTVLPGESAIVEYQPEDGRPCAAEPPFHIDNVAHLWESLSFSGSAEPRAAIAPWIPAVRNPLADLPGSPQRLAASCNLDVSCYADYASQANSVGKLIVTGSTGSWACTGALITTKPYTGNPYFLTANHCIGSDSDARGAVVYWHYKTATCGGPAPSFQASTWPEQSRGQALLATKGLIEGDFSLVQLLSLPNTGLVLSGWRTSDPNLGEAVTGIHHPTASYMRIAFGNRGQDQAVSISGQTLPADRYYWVNWTSGLTEPGSSGSPLFTWSPALLTWVISGSLTAGPDSKTSGFDPCAPQYRFGLYSRFAKAYSYLSPFLNLESCSFSLNPPNATVGGAGETRSFSVTAGAGCAWQATASDSWVKIISGSGSGPGQVTYSVDPNPGSAARTSTIRVSDQTFTITQLGRSLCQPASISVGQTVTGSIGASGCTSDRLGPQHFASPYTFSGTAGQRVSVFVSSGQFDAYATLYNPNGSVLMEDDDGGGGTNARIPPGGGSVTLATTGPYTIEVTSFWPGETGTFQVTLAAGSQTLSNDEIAGATVISQLPAAFAQDVRDATTNASDPVHSCTGSQDSKTVWYRMTAPVNGRLRINTSGSNYDTVLALYPASLAYPGLSPVGELACNDDVGSTVLSEIGFDVTAGASYLVEISQFGNGTGGTLVLNVSLSSGAAARFVPVAPCRVVDTRIGAGVFGGPGLADNTRSFPIADGPCGIPRGAAAYSLNVTAVPKGPLSYLTLWPAGQPQPYVSTLNSFDGSIRANAAIVPAGAGGAVSVYASGSTDVVLDINGYFVSGSSQTGLAFYPVTPCRVFDSRGPWGAFGGPQLSGGSVRVVSIAAGACNLPASAQAYSTNVTVVPAGPLSYLTVWPAGSPLPGVSTLNALKGLVTSNAAIVPAGAGAAISLFPTSNTDVIIDVNGYFAPAGPGGLFFYPSSPCRVADTRNSPGAALSGSRDVPIAGVCGLPQAAAYAVNLTAVPQGALGYLTVWPAGTAMPVVSTLNSFDGSVVANAAIVPANKGTISTYANGTTNLVVDANGYFAP